jgi:hypothetical protein
MVAKEFCKNHNCRWKWNHHLFISPGTEDLRCARDDTSSYCTSCYFIRNISGIAKLMLKRKIMREENEAL